MVAAFECTISLHRMSAAIWFLRSPKLHLVVKVRKHNKIDKICELVNFSYSNGMALGMAKLAGFYRHSSSPKDESYRLLYSTFPLAPEAGKSFHLCGEI